MSTAQMQLRSQIAQERLQEAITRGMASASTVVERVMRQQPTDALVPGAGMRFDVRATSPEAREPIVEYAGRARRIHPHALAQMAERAGVPIAYLRGLYEGKDAWRADLATEILTRHYHEGAARTRYLARSVNDDSEIRGFLSDRFRRLDERPLLDIFISEATKAGAVPFDGTASDTRSALKVIRPQVIEPIPGEFMVIGAEQSNSNFGNGTYSIRCFGLRLVCLNGMVGSSMLREVHLGGRLPETIEFSAETYKSDTKTMMLATRDTAKGMLSEAAISRMGESITRSASEEVSWASAVRKLSTLLSKAELATAKQQFESNETVMLPPEPTAWRLSNVLSWMAGENSDPDRKLELQQYAGRIAGFAAGDAQAA